MTSSEQKRCSPLLLTVGILIMLVDVACCVLQESLLPPLRILLKPYLWHAVIMAFEGLILIVFSFLSSDKQNNVFHPMTTFLSVLWGSIAAGFTLCSFFLMVHGSIGSPVQHPIEYQCSYTGFVVGSVMLLIVGAWYLWVRLRVFSIKGVLVDVLMICVSFIPAWWVTSCVEQFFDHYVFV